MGGIELWPLIFIATLAVYYMNGYPAFVVLIMPFIYVLQSVVGAYILKKWQFNMSIKRLQDMIKIMIVTLVSGTIVPTFGIISRYLDHHFFGGPLPTLTWGDWFTGNIMSLLIVSPFLIRWIANPRFKITKKQTVEIGSAFIILLLVNYALFWTQTTQIGNISLVYFDLIPLMWISLRFGSRFTTLAMFITAIMAIAGNFVGHPMAVAPDKLGIHLFQIEVLIDILAGLFFILAAIEDERKAVINKLESHIIKLEQAVGMRDEFISIASHELKTPVTTLKIYSQVVRKELEQKGEQLLGGQMSKMDLQLNKLITLVEDLLNVSRTRSGKLEFHIQEFDLALLVKETVDDVQSSTPQHTFFLEGRLLRPIMGDKYRISQVLINLLNNAVKYSPNASEINVSLFDEGDKAKVSVKDYGIGIDPKHHEKIFDLFYRVSDPKTNTFPGFGIGLHISHEIIARHGGALSVQSSEDQGSEFSFTLPYLQTSDKRPVS